MSGRRKARELVLQACYALELSGNSLEQVIETVIIPSDLSQTLKDFTVELFKQTVAHVDEYDEIIKVRATNWEFERIAIIDKLVLRIAICEFLYFPDIPPKVSIDEAIEIAKSYSTEQSGRFVNGIADAILIALKEAGRIQKSGRGLQDKK